MAFAVTTPLPPPSLERPSEEGSFEAEPSTKSKKGKKSKATNPPKSPFDVPDRVTGQAGLEELRALSPHRPWRFVEVNIPAEDLDEIQTRVRMLMYPSKTVLDLSIATALWCASRGFGKVCVSRTLPRLCVAYFSFLFFVFVFFFVFFSSSSSFRTIFLLVKGPDETFSEYRTQARVLLVGIGADEQLGGYGRHRVRFNTSGWEGLIREMQLDLDRISHRNLGRDDRCIADHGREARFPFLDENLVAFLGGLPIWQKANMLLPRGEGEKVLLRVAARRLGLGKSTSLPKRAIQFGSRIAKLRDKKEKGDDEAS